ncbi:MAG: trigger factor [Chloroflexota bacterium]
MKVAHDKTENSEAYLTIEVEPTEVEESMEKTYRRLVQRRTIPGFRKGKAPRAVFERYVGRKNLLEDAITDLVPEVYEKALKEQGIEPIARPQLELAQTEPMILKAIVPLKPTVQLGDYKHIQVEPVPPTEVTEDTIDAVIEELRHQHATWEPVERPVDAGDLIAFDIWSNVEDKPFLNQKGAQYQVQRDSSFPAPGFAEQIIGLKKDEEKEFKLSLPTDYSRSEVAGKEASFKVRINEIKQEVLPPLNDEFATTVNPDFKTVAELRKAVADDMKARAEERARSEFEDKAIKAAVALTKVEFPPVLVDDEIHHLLEQRFQRGNDELETYLRTINKTEEQLHDELRPLATDRVTNALVLGKVTEEEKIEVSDTEIDGEIEKATSRATEKKEELGKVLNTPQARQSIRQSLLVRKTIEKLVEIAQSNAVEEPKSKPKKTKTKTKDTKETKEE